MGLDGFAMSNLGLGTEMTSAQMASQAEQLAQKDSLIKIKDVEESAEKQEIKRKKKDEQEQSETPFEDGFEEKQDGEAESETPKKGLISEKDFEKKDPKEFSVRINPKTNRIELFNNKDDNVLETINANDLMGLISKLDTASGILVNRKI